MSHVLARLVTRASGGTVFRCDLRVRFTHWLEETGIRKSHPSAYLGHGAQAMTGHYEIGGLPGKLVADADRLRA